MTNRPGEYQMFPQQRPLLTAELLEYLQQQSSPSSPALQNVERLTRSMGIPGMMLLDPLAGRLLAFLTALMRPALALDIGTFTGYSTLCIAEELPPEGRVVTCEIDPARAAAAATHFAASAYGDRIDLRVASAEAVIESIDRPIDLAFIDADKQAYWPCYDLLVPRLAPDGLIVIDNTLLLGSVLLDASGIASLPPRFRKDCAAIVAFNQRVRSDDRTEQCLLPVGDGLTIVRKRASA